MEVQKCIECGRIFKSILEVPICPACRERSDDKIYEIEEYLRENRGGDLYTVAEACHVDPDQLRLWLKGNRIEFAEDSALKIPCEVCGELIHSGKLCEKCKKREWRLIQSLAEELEESHELAQKEESLKHELKDTFYFRNRT